MRGNSLTRVAIVDFGLSNLDSIFRAVEECGGNPVVTKDPADLEKTGHIILPGTGTFADAMDNLRSSSLDAALTEHVIERKAPFLGICLGMQLLSEKGYESGGGQGLGFIEGIVDRLQSSEASERIPHVGWNEVYPRSGCPLFEGIPDGIDFYFVHSYHFAASAEATVLATTPYCGGFVSAVEKGNVFGVQFHPEKSQHWGFQLLRNFLAL